MAVKYDHMPSLLDRHFNIQTIMFVNANDKICKVTDRRAFCLWGLMLCHDVQYITVALRALPSFSPAFLVSYHTVFSVCKIYIRNAVIFFLCVSAADSFR